MAEVTKAEAVKTMEVEEVTAVKMEVAMEAMAKAVKAVEMVGVTAVKITVRAAAGAIWRRWRWRRQ